MNRLNSTNFKENNLFLKLIILTVIIILFRLELSFPGVHFFQGDHQFIIGTYTLFYSNIYSRSLISSEAFCIEQKRFYINKIDTNKKLWDDYHYDITKNTILKDSLIRESIDSFFEKYMSKLDNEHIIVLFRVKTNNGIVSTIGALTSLSKDDKKYYYQYIIDRLYIKNDEYRKSIITSIIFSFGIRKGTIEKKTLLSEHSDPEFNNIYQRYRKFKLPITMDPLNYGKLISIERSDSDSCIVYYVQITPLTYAKIIQEDHNLNEVTIFKNGEPIIEYTDKLIIDENTILRTIGNNKYYYDLKGNLKLVNIEKVIKYIKSKNLKPMFNEKFITLDIETRVIDGKHVPYLISWFKDNIKNKRSFYVTNYINYDEMIKDCILSLCKLRFNYHKVYIHNFAKFDAIFILKNLSELSTNVDIIINDGRIINIEFKYKKEEWKEPMVLSFRDSYQILPASLRKLAKSFDVEQQKTIFPYNFVNDPNINLLYSGKVPAFNYFDNISYEDYKKYCSQFQKQKWSLLLESSKYCLQDCKALHQVITKFNEFYYNHFKININDAPTISSHAFLLFRSKFMKKEIIPMIYGNEYDFIKTSYTGGSTDMFIPTNNKDELIYGYDVNSLYPFIMKNYYLPVGKKTYFEGDITKYNKDPFGFFYCEVEAPSNLIHPVIQLHVKTKGGIRTMAPTGTFKTVIFSEEMKNAIKLGYKFKILKGYSYDKEIIFDKYVEDLYKIRLEYDKSHPMNYIAKLFLNSLYGRFGMKDIFDTILLLNSEKYFEITADLDNKPYYINDIIKLNDNYLIQVEEKVKQYHKLEYNVNVAIAAAITSYARVYMSKFKNNPNLKLFYTDTDSIYTNLNQDDMNNLFPGIVNSKELGKLKLETVSSRAIFISPKCYCLETVEGNFIYKVKGLINKTDVNLNDFNHLLTKDSLITKNQTKWYKSLSEGTISLVEQTYTLQQTDNKRNLIYNSNNQLIGTKPYNLINNEI